MDIFDLAEKWMAKIAKLESELTHYKQEAEKIPQFCKYDICLWEKEKGESATFWRWVLKQRKECPQVCPKWKGGGQDAE